MQSSPDFLFALPRRNEGLDCYYYSKEAGSFVRNYYEKVPLPTEAWSNLTSLVDKLKVAATEFLSDEQVAILVCQLSVARREAELLSINTILRRIKLQYFLSGAN